MTLEIFMSVFVVSATATSFVIEAIKKFLQSLGVTYKTMPLAVFVSFLVGFVEVFIMTCSTMADITITTVVFALCSGITNVIGTTIGYDTAKKLILSLFDVK